MIRTYVKLLLFVSSYIPLYIIFIIQNYSSQLLVFFFGSLIVTIVVMLTIIYVLIRRLSQSTLLQVEDVENLNKVNLEYFVVYIVPFLGIDILSLNTDLALLFLFVIIGFMYVRSDSIFMNPTFTLIGLNIFKLKTANKGDVVLITRNTPKKNKPSSALQLTEGIFVDTKSGRKPPKTENLSRSA